MKINRSETGPRVLDDVRVLDFTGIIAGSYCTRLMADLGADVLKVEPLEGELIRHIAPMRNKVSTVFAALNSGKRSISLDLKKPAAVEICKRLVAHYDVVVENFSPGVMHRFGLDYSVLKAINPRLIMCSISGFGQTGPGAKRPAFAPIVQAMSGFEWVTLENQPDNDRPLNMGLPVGDTTASQQAFGAISAALYYREKTGIGQYIDIAMLDSLLATMHRDFQAAFDDEVIDRLYGPIAAADGFVMAMPLTHGQFEGLCRCIGHAELITDERFTTMGKRLENYNALIQLAEQWAQSRPVTTVVAAFEAEHIPCAPYHSIPEACEDPQLAHRQMITQVEDAAGPLKVPNSPFLFSETQAAVKKSVATLGSHTEQVLREELGYDAAHIKTLADEGVTRNA